MSQTIIHGGDIATASTIYGIAAQHWIDLSTGINPRNYPFAPPSLASYRDLPYPREDFIQAAANFYGSSQFVATAGSQSVIQALPQLLADLPLLLPAVGYQEYRYQWQLQGRTVVDYTAFDGDAMVAAIDAKLANNPAQHIVVIRPNNPTGVWINNQQLLHWANQLSQGAYLIVDEAFIEAEQEDSLLNSALPDNCIVLRSFGKFFGLAGIRLGFVFASSKLRDVLHNGMGLWAANGVAQSIATQAFNDKAWQRQALININEDKLASCEALYQPVERDAEHVVHKALFSTYRMAKDQAEKLYQAFAQEGVLLRLIDVDEASSLIRAGRVATNSQTMLRLETVSKKVLRRYAKCSKSFNTAKNSSPKRSNLASPIP